MLHPLPHAHDLLYEDLKKMTRPKIGVVNGYVKSKDEMGKKLPRKLLIKSIESKVLHTSHTCNSFQCTSRHFVSCLCLCVGDMMNNCRMSNHVSLFSCVLSCLLREVLALQYSIHFNPCSHNCKLCVVLITAPHTI